MRDLVIDIGNTQLKWALFEGGVILQHGRTMAPLDLALNDLQAKVDPDRIAIASVRELPELTQAHLMVDIRTPMPVQIHYDTPETLGIDRVLAAVGAVSQFPGHPLLVVDMGTCITMDLITPDGSYQGGTITPGMQMRFKAMNQWTDKLPLLEMDIDSVSLPGKSTKASMQNGVFYGILHEIQGTLTRYREEFGDVHLILTGGDAQLFESRLKNGIFADSLLVLKGLHEILLFNEDHY